jgi:site-specific DNA recombinase
MPSTNGHGPKRAVLYARVSTDEQAKSGFSIPGQLRELRVYAKRERLNVVEEIVDDGYSGSNPDRPGLRRVLELAEAGEVDVAVAWKRNRLFRSRLYRLLWERDLKGMGVSLVALDDTGHRIADGMLDDFGEWEREEITRRTLDGKREKARAGMVIGGHPVSYGFEYAYGLDHKGRKRVVGYKVADGAMRNVRRIFEAVASGTGLRTVKNMMDEERIPTPGGGRFWSRPFLRALILDDLYKPHTVEELRTAGVSEQVIVGFDPERRYGIYQFEGIPVPIPDAGIPRETVERARANIAENCSPSRAGNRFWELSGGIMRCAECGRAMQTLNVSIRRKHFYYRCQNNQNNKYDPCAMRKNVRTDAIEPEVWARVRDALLDPGQLRADLDAMIEQERASTYLTDPAKEAKHWAERLAELDRDRAKDQEMYRADAMTLDELKANQARLEEARKTAERELAALCDREEHVRTLEQRRDALIESLEATAPEALDSLTSEERHQFYKLLDLRVEVGPDGRPDISGRALPEALNGVSGFGTWSRPCGR